MRESTKAALGGIVSALAVIVMLVTYLSPLLVYTAPPFAGILLILIVNELGNKWAVGTYVSISLLSIFFIADKESAVFFTMFFGYYPILKLWMDAHLKRRPIRIIAKLFIFNVSIAAAVAICVFVFHIPYDDFTEAGFMMVGVFWVMLNGLLVVYDFLVTTLQRQYENRLKKSIRRIFRH